MRAVRSHPQDLLDGPHQLGAPRLPDHVDDLPDLDRLLDLRKWLIG